jgi:hypothetical protein
MDLNCAGSTPFTSFQILTGNTECFLKTRWADSELWSSICTYDYSWSSRNTYKAF